MAAPADEERFRTLYRRHHPAISAYFARRIGSQDAADAADDVFAVAWRRMDAVPGDDDALLWLYGVARNVLANRRRGARRHDRLLARVWNLREPDLFGPEPQVLRSLDGQQAMRALASLRRSDRELLLLSYWEELTHVQIAELLGLTKSAVDARVHRALVRMRHAMSRTGYDQRTGKTGPSAVKEQA